MQGESIALLIFFFFQAEDGIRDVAVTGVQTCALPILGRSTPCDGGGGGGARWNGGSGPAGRGGLRLGGLGATWSPPPRRTRRRSRDGRCTAKGTRRSRPSRRSSAESYCSRISKG